VVPEEGVEPSRSHVLWKSLDQLTEGPDRGGVVGDVEMEDFAGISWRSSWSSLGRPTGLALDFHRQ
jgi:hypothetical protein